MSRLLLLLYLLCLWLPTCTSLKVFSFERTREAKPGSLSFATLDSETSEDLPPRFHLIFEEKKTDLNSHQVCLVLVAQAGRLGSTGGFSMFMESTTNPGSQSGSIADVKSVWWR